MAYCGLGLILYISTHQKRCETEVENVRNHTSYDRFRGTLSPRVFDGGLKYSVTKVESLGLSPDVFVKYNLVY
ncbi:hypothetical protein MTCD1_02552 [Colwellia marinimaniae]|uniref:Uncharacterized protein n=1 Tax=Colwellia marinimaniae TaxID=1513592 RepID=A0ABQ0MXA7_9GAMM|nr:hypothetical protein MTCD1_02552 [Colwellia marinimaniae]